MKKTRNCALSILTLVLFSFTACKNFFNNENLLNDLNECVQYRNRPYNNVIILADLKATKSIIPSVNVYDDCYKVSDLIELSFTPNKNYRLLNWLVEPKESVEFIDCEETDTEITLKIVEEGEIKIQAICGTEDTLNIIVKSDYATVSPTEQAAFNDETFEITCREEADYYFLNWEVFDSLGEQITDYSDILDFKDSTSRITEVTVKQTGIAVFIKPKIVIRPKVVSASPNYDINGALRDSKIVIMFNRPIDESCLYFTEEEVSNFLISGFSVLRDKNHENKCYGYITSEGKVIYKNIEIKNANIDTGDYLKYYKAPFFEENHPDVLKIPANNNNLPPTVTNILVKISKDFCYIENDLIKIPMNGDFSFSYRTNENVDKNLPYFGMYDDQEKDFVICDNDSRKYAYLDEITEASSILKPKAKDIAAMNLTSKKLLFHGVVCDGDSGPANLKWDITKVDCELEDIKNSNGDEHLNIYPVNPAEPFHINGTLLEFEEDLESEKRINEVLDLSSYNLTEGFYKLIITATDFIGNSSSKIYYFVYDDVKLDARKFFYTTVTTNKIRSYINVDILKDLYKISYSIDDEPAEEYERLYDNYYLLTEYDYEGVGNKHNIYATVYDYAGNKNQLVLEEELAIGNIAYYDINNTHIRKTLCSKNLYLFDIMTPYGIVCSLPENDPEIDAGIWSIEEAPSGTFAWGNKKAGYKGEDDYHKDQDDGSGLTFVAENASEDEDNETKTVRMAYYEGTIFYYKRKFFDKEWHLSINWFVPSIKEYKDIFVIKDTLQNTANLLNQNGINAVVLDGTIFGTSNSDENQYSCIDINGNVTKKNKETKGTKKITPKADYPSYHLMCWAKLY